MTGKDALAHNVRNKEKDDTERESEREDGRSKMMFSVAVIQPGSVVRSQTEAVHP